MATTTQTKPQNDPFTIPQDNDQSKAMTIQQRRAGGGTSEGVGKVVEPFQHPAPKLTMAPPDMQPWKMPPPSMSPLHMSPPNMLLPDMSPIQDHMPLPTLSASTFIPPQSFLTHQTEQPISVVRFSRSDPTFLAVGTSQREPDEALPNEENASVFLYRVEDVEREVRGDRNMIAGPANEVRMKIRPRLHHMSTLSVDSAVLDVQFSPHNRNLMVVTLASGSINFYKTRSGRYTAKLIGSYPISPGSPVHSFSFSPTDSHLVSASLANGTALILDIDPPNEPPEVVHTLQASSRVLHTAFSVDGKRVFVATASGAVTEFSVSSGKQRWTDDNSPRGLTTVLPWPAPGAGDIGKKRRSLLTGSFDGTLRILDMTTPTRPPLTSQTLDLAGQVNAIAALPPLPALEEIGDLEPGVFAAPAHPHVELDPTIGGVLAAAGKGGGRVIIHKQKFEEVFLPKRDGSDIVDWKTADGVSMDAEGREKQFWWYDLADIEEHGEGAEVVAADACAMIDFDPLFRDGSGQRRRRGWRLCTADRDGGLIFWQVYME